MDVALVVGHRLSKQGAVALDGETTEWRYNYRLAELLAGSLIDLGATAVVVLRQDDADGYRALPAQVNAQDPRCCVSLHLNSWATPGAHGSEVVIAKGSKGGWALGNALLAATVGTLGLRSRGIVQRSRSERGGRLLWGVKAPCVILEPGFCSAPKDWDRLTSRRERLALALAEAIKDWLAAETPEPPETVA